jgi:protein ImuA
MMEQREQTFPAAQMLGGAGSCQDYWSLDLKEQPTKNEIFCRLDDAAGAGFALALAAQSAAGKPWLWVQDKQSRRRSGMPYIHGLPEGIRHNLHYIAAQTCEDALFAMEEGLRCAGISFVIGELSGDPKALGFTASRRLAVASEAHGVPLYLLRGDASAAPSSPHRWDNRAPGAPQAQAELFRTRLYRPGRWWLTHEDGKLTAANIKDTQTANLAGTRATGQANRVDLAALIGDQPLAASGRG